jgi:enterochelin esterase-like enzyme
MNLTRLDASNHLTYTELNRRSRRLGVLPRADGSLIYLIRILIFIGLLFLVSTCTYTPIPPTQINGSSSTVPIMSPTPVHNLTLDPSPTPTRIATPQIINPTTPLCSDQQGIIIISELDTLTLPNNMPFRIYLPPCYAENTEARYPTLYLLHGLTADDSQWDELGVDERANALITSEELPPLIIVMPWHRTGVDLEMAVVNILVPHIDQTYRTLADSSWRAIGGLSRGGGWALRVGLRHPELFGAMGLHSPANFLNTFYIASLVDNIAEEHLPRIWIDIGERDSLLESTHELIDIFDELGIPVSSQIYPGDHDPEYWTTHMDTYLRWYTYAWLYDPYHTSPRIYPTPSP